MDVSVHEAQRGHARCAFCHGDLRMAQWTCPRCATELHAECARELGRCPTLGCEGENGTTAVPVRRRAPPVPRVSRRDAWIGTAILGALLAVLLLLGGAGLLPGSHSREQEWGGTRGRVVRVEPGERGGAFTVSYDVEGTHYQDVERSTRPHHVGEDVPVTYFRSDPSRAFLGQFGDERAFDRRMSTVILGAAVAAILAFVLLIWRQHFAAVRRYGPNP